MEIQNWSMILNNGEVKIKIEIRFQKFACLLTKNEPSSTSSLDNFILKIGDVMI